MITSNFPFPILFRNSHFVIINKPAGIPVHPNRNHQKSIEDFLPLLSRRKDGPWLAHRLDQDTAGCLLIALRKQALIEAQKCFSQGKVTKIYWAIVQGKPKQDRGIIENFLSKQYNDNKKWFIKTSPTTGQKAITTWRVLGSNENISCLELYLHTGRTHQARVHCASLGCRIIGDNIYGASDHHSLQLFNRYISLPLDPVIETTATPPKHMVTFLKALSLI
ncbi:MAG: RluA family pseudouridine synthase [Commensalibacter sp.]|nr:RluA family pseudouridine synthase [Commensalibacter sp.]